MPSPPPSPTVAHLRARLARASHDPADPKLPELRRDLAAEHLAEHIRKVVDSAPPFTALQRAKLAALLAPPSTSDGEA